MVEKSPEQSSPPPPEKKDDPLIGLLVADKYRVTARLARGGMGRIYLAEQQPLGRPVVLKVLDDRAREGSEEFEQRFLLEASTYARLRHPNTVTIFDYGRLALESEQTWYMVMEYIQGETLRAALRRQGHFSPQRALWVCREVARSLREAHRLGVVHRDLKPTNVMLSTTEEGEIVKVLDFGIVKLMDGGDSDADLTRGGRLVGTPRYMAPEMIRRREGGIDGRTDLYSLGIMLYELLSGRVPFTGDTMDVAIAQLSEPVPIIADLTGVSVPPIVEAIALRCLQKRPEDRYPDVSAFIAALDEVLNQLGPAPAHESHIHARPTMNQGWQDHSHSRSYPSLVMMAPQGSPAAVPNLAPEIDLDDDDLQIERGGRWLPALLLLGIALASAALALWWIFQEPAQPPDDPAQASLSGAQGGRPDPATAASGPAAGSPAVAQEPDEAHPEHAQDAEAAPEPRLIAVHTQPAGAQIFDGPVLLGESPLKVSLGLSPRQLRIESPGYRAHTLTLDAQSPALIEQALLRQSPPPTPPGARAQETPPSKSAPSAAPASRAQGTAPAKSPATAPPSAAPQKAPASADPALDIRMTR